MLPRWSRYYGKTAMAAVLGGSAGAVSTLATSIIVRPGIESLMIGLGTMSASLVATAFLSPVTERVKRRLTESAAEDLVPGSQDRLRSSLQELRVALVDGSPRDIGRAAESVKAVVSDERSKAGRIERFDQFSRGLVKARESGDLEAFDEVADQLLSDGTARGRDEARDRDDRPAVASASKVMTELSRGPAPDVRMKTPVPVSSEPVLEAPHEADGSAQDARAIRREAVAELGVKVAEYQKLELTGATDEQIASKWDEVRALVAERAPQPGPKVVGSPTTEIADEAPEVKPDLEPELASRYESGTRGIEPGGRPVVASGGGPQPGGEEPSPASTPLTGPARVEAQVRAMAAAPRVLDESGEPLRGPARVAAQLAAMRSMQAQQRAERGGHPRAQPVEPETKRDTGRDTAE